MSHQLRVSALLPARKPAVEQRQDAKHAHAGAAVAGHRKPATARLEITTTVVEAPPAGEETPHSEEQLSTPVAAPRRTRSNSCTPTARSEAPAAAAAAPASATPSKRKKDSVAAEKTAADYAMSDSPAKKRKTRHQQGDDEQQEAAPAAAAVQTSDNAAAAVADHPMEEADASPVPTAIASSNDAPMELDLGGDIPFVLPPLEPLFTVPAAIPSALAATPLNVGSAQPPANARTLSRGATMLVRRGVPLPASSVPIAAAPAASSATGLSSETVAKVRAANAAHASVMAMINELAPPMSSAAAASSTTRPAAASARAPASLAAAPARPFVFPSAAASTSMLADSKPFVLPFPTHFSFLIKVFSGLDSTLDMLLRRQKVQKAASWNSELRQPLARVVGKDVTLGALQQLLTIYHGCYTITESRTTDSMGRFSQDYRIGFGLSALMGLEQDEEEKLRLAIAEGLNTNDMSSGRPNLVARRQQLEARMKQYVYEKHQLFLATLQKDASSASSSSSGKQPPLSPADLSSISVMLQTPLPRLPVWHPLFKLDSPSHCPSLPLQPLSNSMWTEARKEEAKKGQPMSLLQLTMQRQAIPQTISLEAENRGKKTSTNGGAVKAEGAPAAASSSSSPASAAPVSALSTSLSSSKSLSVLSSSTLARLSSSISSRQHQQASEHGDPKEREKLREIMRVREMYEAVKGHLKQHQQNPLIMLVPELTARLHVAGKFGDAQAIRHGLKALTEYLPHWCLIKASGRPPVDVFQTKRHPPGADQNLARLGEMVAKQEKKLRAHLQQGGEEEDDDMKTVVMAPSSTTAASSSEPRVKIEGADADVEMRDAPSAATASASSEVKHEIKPEAILAASTSKASSIRAATASRLASPAPSPVRSNVSERAVMMATQGHKRVSSMKPRSLAL